MLTDLHVVVLTHATMDYLRNSLIAARLNATNDSEFESANTALDELDAQLENTRYWEGVLAGWLKDRPDA